MTRIPVTALAAAIVCASALAGAAAGPAPAANPPGWNVKAAAAYLDGRADWWTTWPQAKRDQGTFCVSCHMTAPYVLARPALRKPLGEAARSAPEVKFSDMVAKRVAMWRDAAPFYADQQNGLPKTSESRGSEAILNALVLATRDAETGTLADDTRAAFGNMWALQMKRQALAGAWAWLNFHYEPWEADNGSYFGTTLAAIAVGSAPGGYADGADIQDNVKLLREYLQKEFDRQPLFNQLMAQTASTKLAGALKPEQRGALVDATFANQMADGGWSMASLGTWKRVDNTAIDTASDGYATGLATLALQQAGVAASNAKLAKGLDWLRSHQNPATGNWVATSLNKQRDPASDVGKFMSDAATAYAVLSLTHAASK